MQRSGKRAGSDEKAIALFHLDKNDPPHYFTSLFIKQKKTVTGSS
jgi:hypothetical protein